MPVLVPLAPGLALLIAALVAAVPTPATVRRWAPVAASVAVGAVGAVLLTASGPATALAGVLRADSLSAWMLVTIGSVGVVSTWAGLDRDTGRGYAALLCAFLGAMSLAVVADNLGIVWVAIEATTIATAFLVAHYGTRGALEAAWKYVVLGSVGIAIAFLGVVLIYAASVRSGPTLSWLVLSGDHGLDHGLVRLGAALAVLGFATKAGLAPMHSWLPDAHGQAPAAVSGLMSGVLLAVALYAIVRVQAIADAVLGTGLMRIELAVLGLLSIAVAAALEWRQRDLKRMLAYSSIEHMGVMALGVAIGPTALPAVLLYMLAHGLIKASLFVLSGRLLAAEGTTSLAVMRALLGRRPAIAVPWLAALAGLIGFPPFGIFFAELAIAIAGWRAGLGWAVLVALGLLCLVFTALVRLAIPMLFGTPTAWTSVGPDDRGATPHGAPTGPLLPIGLALAACVVVPFLGGPVGAALSDAAAAVTGSR
ncbi:MAG TPA: proton-conducting transporter membrane subunit [Gryllotalpicola sp.]